MKALSGLLHSFHWLATAPWVKKTYRLYPSPPPVSPLLSHRTLHFWPFWRSFPHTKEFSTTLAGCPTTSFSSDTAVAAAKSLQSCPTLCDPVDGSPPGSPIPGILQARILEWVAISFSNAWKWKVKGKSLSRVWLLATSWTAAHQAPPSVGFSRQEY